MKHYTYVTPPFNLELNPFVCFFVLVYRLCEFTGIGRNVVHPHTLPIRVQSTERVGEKFGKKLNKKYIGKFSHFIGIILHLCS